MKGMSGSARVSMERDLADGRPLEIANIVDPLIREGRARNVPVASLEHLRGLVAATVSPR
jgi:ketopantoate reductase